MSVQRMDDVMGVYMAIIEDTIQRCRNLQNSAVLEQVRERWISNLNERIKQSVVETNDTRIARSASSNRAVKNVAFDKVKIKVKSDPEGMPVPQLHSLSDVFSGEKSSRLKPRMAPVESPDFGSGLWSNAATEGSESESKVLPTVPPVEAEAEEKEEEEDWGDWEDPDNQNQEAMKEKDAEPIERPPEQLHSAPAENIPQEGYIDAQGNYIPSEADFAMRVTTQYGRGNPMINGSNALHWDKPDEIDSDLDNVSDLSDEEPIAKDSIVGQFESVAKPAGRKATSSGMWKIKVRNGIAKVNGQEFFFDTLSADLDF
eukprot:Gregarina_sp_Poly_1__914@NODE_121_length_13560_cov_302_880679_g108_i0_p3_GENE_NODE_121_length_13560_cov_302_880679_g108_i0NODE_121_length_13560_cov_302_880679_g108_i0_p3_ORF_typecomplete_len315_score68_20TFIIA/PF03153_13/4_3e10Spore_III_AF/PF09581_10/0_074_NODE_121_length_13560_cov_302_880679_g108_i01245013394